MTVQTVRRASLRIVCDACGGECAVGERPEYHEIRLTELEEPRQRTCIDLHICERCFRRVLKDLLGKKVASVADAYLRVPQRTVTLP